MQIGMRHGLPLPSAKDFSVDVDLALLGGTTALALQAPAKFASLFRLPDAVDVDEDDDTNNDADDVAAFELVVVGDDSVWVNGLECLASDADATPVPHNAIIEMAGLKFCFQNHI